MNTHSDELLTNGRPSIINLLNTIGGWPVLVNDSAWQEFPYGWEVLTAEVLNKTGVTAILFELTVSHDPNNSSRTVIEV